MEVEEEVDFPSLAFHISLVSSCFSLAGSLFILVSYHLLPQTQSFLNKLVWHLSFADILVSIAVIVNCILQLAGVFADTDDIDYTFCYIFGAFMQTTSFLSFIWSPIITICIYLSIAWSYPGTKFIDNQKYIIGFGYGLTMILTVIGFAANIWGPAGFQCWIKADKSVYRWTHFVGWLFVFFPAILILNVFLILFVYRVMSRHRLTAYDSLGGLRSRRHKKTHRVVLKFMMFPVIFALSWAPINIGRMLESLDSSFLLTNLPDFWTVVVFWTFANTGFLNAIAFGWNENIWRMYVDMCNQSKTIYTVNPSSSTRGPSPMVAVAGDDNNSNVISTMSEDRLVFANESFDANEN